MKPIDLISKLILSLSLIFTSSAGASQNDSPSPNTEKFAPVAVSRFLAIYKNSRNFDDLLKQVEGKTTPADMVFLKKYTHDFKGSLPEVQRESAKVLIFSKDGLRVPVEIVSLEERTFKINQHLINFAELKTAQEHVEAIQNLFPRQAAFHRPVLLNLMVPEAQAFLPILIGAITAGITAYELYTSNSYYCNEILEAANGCKPPIRKMRERQVDFEKIKELAKAKKKAAPNCPAYADKDEKDAAMEVQDEATAALDTVNAKSNSGYGKLIKCDIEWTAAADCKESLDKLSKQLCMNIHSSLSDTKKAVEKNDSRGNGQ